MDRNRKLWFAAIVALALIALSEAVAFGAGRFLQSRWKMFKPPQVPVLTIVDSYADYMAVRDPVLGWPLRTEYGERPRDVRGSGEGDSYERFNDGDCASIYGDSFALGTEVKRLDAWGTLLAKRMKCPVGIYGVNGYGTDQAYLRYKLRENDPAKVVVLTHLSEDIIRNLTRNFDLYTGAANFGLKPRFVLDAQQNLELVAIPDLTEDEYWRYVSGEAPQLILENESFHIGGPAGEVALKFPYSLALVKNLFGFRMRSAFARTPDYAQFYQNGHAMQGLDITAGILKAFSSEAKSRNQRPIIVLLPTRHDLAYFEKTGQWTYASLIADLEAADVEFLEFGGHLMDETQGMNRASLFKPLGHYDEYLNQLLADFVFNEIGQTD